MTIKVTQNKDIFAGVKNEGGKGVSSTIRRIGANRESINVKKSEGERVN